VEGSGREETHEVNFGVTGVRPKKKRGIKLLEGQGGVIFQGGAGAKQHPGKPEKRHKERTPNKEERDARRW